MSARDMFEKLGYNVYIDNKDNLHYCLDKIYEDGSKCHSSIRFDKVNHKIYFGTKDVTKECLTWNFHWIKKIRQQIKELGWDE